MSTKTKKQCETIYNDAPIISNYTGKMVRTSKENGLFLSAVRDAVLRNVRDTKTRLAKATSTTEGLAITLNGGYLAMVDDGTRAHSGQAFKIETLEVIAGYADTLTISVEVSTDHSGLLNTVRLVPTVTHQSFLCSGCAYETTKDMKVGTFYEMATRLSGACHICGVSVVGGSLVKITYHVSMPDTIVKRLCGCADISYRGVVVGDVLDVTPLAVVDAIRSLRAKVAMLGENALADILSPVKAIQQFDGKVLHAVNLWNSKMINGRKVEVIRVSL